MIPSAGAPLPDPKAAVPMQVALADLFTNVPAGVTAAALIAVPIVLGLVAGRAIGGGSRGRLHGARRPLLMSFSLALLCAPLVAAAGVLVRVGFWDGALMGFLFGGAAGVMAFDVPRRSDGRALLLSLVSTVVALGAGEVACRALLPRAGITLSDSRNLFLPRFDPNGVAYERRDGTSHALMWRLQRADGCALTYPEIYPVPFLDRAARKTPPQRVILHIGDSMVFGHGVERDQAFPVLLEQADPRYTDVNAGSSGMSADYYYEILHRWTDRLPVKLGVVYLFLNDPLEMDRLMPCCDERPLLAYDDDGVHERCPAPQWSAGYGNSLAWFARNSPLPFSFIFASGYSQMLAHVEELSADSFAHARFEPDHLDNYWQHLELAVQAMRDDYRRRGIPLAVVVLPLSQVLDAPAPKYTSGYRNFARLKSIAENLGITTLDPWDYFEALVKKDGIDAYFIPGRDVHFNARGHRMMADWLASRLPPLAAP